MKSDEKKLARKLRARGWSINKIYRELGVSKSSVSLWVRDIELTATKKEMLQKGRFTRKVIEKARLTRLKNENQRRQLIIDRAKTEIRSISKKDLHLIGTMLYWGEGGKTGGIVRFTNSDSKMILIMMRFFREICNVPEKKFRGYIHIHQHLQYKKAEKYWSEVSRIPLKQFYKTYRKPNKSSQNKKDSLPLGTFDIYICNTELFLKIKGWTEKVYEVTMKNAFNPPR